jgi:hypothetical protein
MTETKFDYGQDLQFSIEDGSVKFYANGTDVSVPLSKMNEVLKFITTVPEDLSVAIHVEGGVDIAMLPQQFKGEKMSLIVITYRNEMVMLEFNEFKRLIDEEADRNGLEEMKA